MFGFSRALVYRTDFLLNRFFSCKNGGNATTIFKYVPGTNFPTSNYLKGLSGQNEQGSRLVSIESSFYKEPALDCLFKHNSTPIEKNTKNR